MEKSHSLKRTLCLFGILVQTILLNAQTAVFNKSMNSALAGDPLSQLAVGEWYCQGAQGVSVDFEKGYTWITKALENPKGLKNEFKGEGNNYLGIIHLNGFYGPKDPEKAKVYFKKAAEYGALDGWYNLGLIGKHKLDDNKTTPTMAFNYFKKAAEGGHPSALFEVGYSYSQGFGVEKDMDAAIKWYRKAIDKGEPSAMVNLAAYFYNSEGEEKDVREAYRLWKIAESKGSTIARNNLQLLYNRPKPKQEPTHLKKKGENGLWGLFTQDGVELLPYEYSNIKWFNGVYKLERAFHEGIATAEGIEIIKPDKYTYIESRGEGYIVHIGGNRGFVGCTDNSGKEIIPPEKYRWACHYGKDINVVKLGGQTGVCDDSGKLLFMTNYDVLNPFVNSDGSIAYYKSFFQSDTGRVDATGKDIIPIKMKKNKNKFKASFNGKDYYWVYDVNGRCGIEDANHKVILPCNYDYLGVVSGRIKATQNEYTGVFSMSGAPIVPMGKYHDVYMIDSVKHKPMKFYRVYYKDKVGACDENGKEIIAPDTYSSLNIWTSKDIVDADYKVSRGDFHGLIKKNGQVVLPIKYTSYSLHSRKKLNKPAIFYVKLYGKEGLCDSLGNEIVSPKYDNIISTYSYNLPDEYFRIELGDKEGIMRDDGTVIVAPDKYDDVRIDKYTHGDKSGQLYILAKNDTGKFDYSMSGAYLGKNTYDEYMEKLFADARKEIEFDGFFDEGQRKFESGKYSAAIKSYKKALQIREDDAAYYNIGAAYYNQNSYKKAIENFEKCIRISKSDTRIAKARDLIRKSNDYWEQKKERRSQIAMSILGAAVGVGMAALQYSQNNGSTNYNNNVPGGFKRDTSLDYLLDPRYAAMQVQQEYYREYLQMTNGGTTMTYEEWFQKIKGPALAEEWRIEHGLSSGDDSNFDETDSYKGELSPDQYQAAYQRWESRVQDWFNNLTSGGYKVQDKQGNIKGKTDGDMKGWAYVGNQAGLRRAQNEMRKIRLEAEKYGVHIPQSKWETATSSY